MRTRFASAVLSGLLFLPFTTMVFAAPEPPEGLKAGDAALAAKDLPSAAEAYRSALEEEPRCWKAREGLARVLAGQGDMPAAIQAWRRAMLDADRAETVAKSDCLRLREARTALARRDPATRELHKLLADASKDLIRFAGTKKKKSPAASEEALRRALRLDALCTGAEAALKKQGALPSGVWTQQFHGTMADWGGLNSSEWKVLDESSLEVDGRKAGFSAKSDLEFCGDFDMRVEIRILEKVGASWGVSLRAGQQGMYDAVELGVQAGQVYLHNGRWQGQKAPPLYNLPVERLDPPIDPGVFNSYELRLRGDVVTALVNGVKVATARRSFHRHHGAMAIYCGYARAVFRNFEVRQP